MKGRGDPTTPLSVKIEASHQFNHSTKGELFNDNEQETEIEIEEEVLEPPVKRPRKTYKTAKILQNDVVSPRQTIQYIISHDDSVDPISNDDILEIQQDSTPPPKESDRFKKRSKGFGKYVASLMQDIKDDKTFFETQSEILKIIEKATLKSAK